MQWLLRIQWNIVKQTLEPNTPNTLAGLTDLCFLLPKSQQCLLLLATCHAISMHACAHTHI